MKKCLVNHLALGFSLVVLSFLSGCSQQSLSGSNPFVSSANAEPATIENDLAAVTGATNDPATVAEATTNLLAQTNPPETPQSTNALAPSEAAVTEALPPVEQKPPANVRLSPVLSEVVKLVQSGMEQSVLLGYITNTTGYFALGADEIVYLNDLGVAGSVITTMMQHDQALRDLRLNAAQAAFGAIANPAMAPTPELEVEPEMASAPSYVEAPPMEAEPVYVSDSYFYDTLTPYGSWVYVTGYGRCWRPTAAICNPGWRPYGDRGRWVYSDNGWYWLSDYTWGATAFHYGRWFNAPGTGWCWWPDTVWAPSWVSWRYTSDYCGWAPLPPTACYQSGFGLMYNNGSVGLSFGFGLGYSDYAFVPWGTFCGPRPYQHYVPASRAAQVYNTSTPVNHLEAGGQGKVNNRGIPPDRVRQYSRTEVRTVSLREQAGKSPRNEQLTRDGRTLAVRRPQFTTASAGMAEPAGRSNGQMSPPRSKEALVSKSPQQPASVPPSVPSRMETRNQREQFNGNRPAGQPAMPLAPSDATAVEAKPVVTTPTRSENRAGFVSEPRMESVLENRARAGSLTGTTIPRSPQPLNQSVATPTPTARPSLPRVTPATPQISSRPATASQNSSIVIIGGNNTRSSGRDYSVVNTPSSSPTRNTSRDNFPARSTPAPIVNTPEIAENSAALVTRAQSGGNGQNRGNNNYNNNRLESRGSSVIYSTPQPGQVINPGVRSTPSPNVNNARPMQPSNPLPNYTPPVPPPAASSAARVESRSAPTTPPPTPGRPNR